LKTVLNVPTKGSTFFFHKFITSMSILLDECGIIVNDFFPRFIEITNNNMQKRLIIFHRYAIARNIKNRWN